MSYDADGYINHIDLGDDDSAEVMCTGDTHFGSPEHNAKMSRFVVEWVQGAPKGHGCGRRLMEVCIADAKARGRSGVCMLGSQKQKAWLSDRRFAEKFGFRAVDTAGEYVLLALSFDGTLPRFTSGAKAQTIENRELTVYYDDQCPFIFQRVEKLKEFCAQKGLPARFIHVESAEQAKALPCMFNNWAVFCEGKFATVNQIGGAEVEKLMKRAGER